MIAICNFLRPNGSTLSGGNEYLQIAPNETRRMLTSYPANSKTLLPEALLQIPEFRKSTPSSGLT